MNTSARHFIAISMLYVLAAIASAPAQADGGMTRVFYPTQEAAEFVVDVPSDWKLMAQGEEGAEDYFEVEGPNGLELSFRTVPGADMEKAVKDHIAYLNEHFTDVKLGKQVETKINGMDAIILPAVATDEDDSERDIGAGWFLISDKAIGELWYNVDNADEANKTAASAVLNSLKQG
jgi:hypothetical protein